MKLTYSYLAASLISLCTLLYDVNAQDDVSYRYSHLETSISTAEDLESIFNGYQSVEYELQLLNQDSSLTGLHSTYAVVFDGIKLINHYVKLNQKINDRQSISYPKISSAPPKTSLPIAQSALIQFSEHLTTDERLISAERYWIPVSGKWKQRWVVRVETEHGLNQSILNDQGKPIITKDLNLYNKPDSLVQINIYRPDPVTSARVNYGGDFSDNDDQANDALIESMTKDSISLRWSVENGVWRLISDYARAVDFNKNDTGKVATPPPSFLTPTEAQLEVNRSHNHFEYFNSFYHLNTIHNYIQTLGFTNIVDYPIAFDALAGRSDQSSFTPNDTASKLRYGIGGVDDAEDAEVIVHEYGHAVLNSTTPFTNLGAERDALEEGFGDYLALSYTRKITSFKPDEIMSWDGHNEFWDGRELTYDRTYPTDLANDKYADGVLWASAIGRIADSIGIKATDQILINSTYEWFSQMKLTDASQMFLSSDSLLNEGQHAEIASIIFCDMGLLNGCEDTLITDLPFTEPYLGNTYDFAYNNEPLYIYPNSKSILLFEVFDMHGKMIFERQIDKEDKLFIPFKGHNLRQGVYILRVHTNTGPYSFKIIRTWF